MKATRAALAALAAMLACTCSAALAQGRDPMQAPASAEPAAPGSSAPPAQPQAGRHLMTLNGQRWVVVGARRYGVGDRLGEARIERIEDTAVVVRDAGGTRRLALHPGVVKRPAPQARPAAPNSR